MPSQKPGIARNRTESERATLSGSLFGRNALTMPTGSRTSHEMITDKRPISALSGPRCRMSSETLSPRKNDRPRLPPAMSRIQRAYCTGSGSLSPRSSMIRARSAGASLAKPSSPNMATSGSPGRTRNTTKMIKETPTSVETPNSARWSRDFFRSALARQPDVVPAHHVVDAKERGWVLAAHAVVPGVVDLLVRDRQQRRGLLPNGLPPAHPGLSPAILHPPLHLTREGRGGRGGAT